MTPEQEFIKNKIKELSDRRTTLAFHIAELEKRYQKICEHVFTFEPSWSHQDWGETTREYYPAYIKCSECGLTITERDRQHPLYFLFKHLADLS